MVPIIGARKLVQLDESLAALKLDLSSADLDRLATALPKGAAAGTRYDAYQMGHLDSEKQAV